MVGTDERKLFLFLFVNDRKMKSLL